MGTISIDDQTSSSANEPAATRQHILVIGDAVGGGLGAGLQRMAKADGHYDVTIRYNEESGLARPEVYDWPATLPRILQGKQYDVVVVLLGTNDRQPIRSGGQRLAFDTPEWVAAYQQQLSRMLDELVASGAKVYWIAIPPMANRDYDAAMRIITALQKKGAEARGITFLNLNFAFLNPDGSYTDTGPDDTGTVRRLRGRDGVSFYKRGNNRMGQLVLAALEKAAKSGAAPGAADNAATSGELARVPVFGRANAAGEDVTVRPRGVVAAASPPPHDAAFTGPPANATMAALQAMARPGSDAARLFTTGESPMPPRGRLDDFTLPAGNP